MLKYLNIIQQLSDSDKIHILCDINLLEEKKYRVLGIPALRMVSLQDFHGADAPSPLALSNTWDPLLAENVANHLFRAMAEQGVDLAIIPGPKLKINPYRAALSEDPALSCAMVASYMRAAAQFGVSVILDGFCILPDEVEWLDQQPDEQVLREFIIKPYLAAIGADACKGVLTAAEPDTEGWNSINASLCNILFRQMQEKDCFFLSKRISPEQTVRHLIQGGLCFQGSALALESALERYKQLEKSVAHGEVAAEELAKEIDLGRAISPDTLDEATDRLLSFLFSAKRKPTVSSVHIDPRTIENAFPASMVLLKNQKVLPMKKGAGICLIGDIALDEQESGCSLISQLQEQLTARGFHITGISRGYDLSQERSDPLIKPAVNLAEQSDLALLFLGLGKQREKKTHKTTKISIPANQQALLDQLAASKQKVIAILPPEGCPDVAIPENCAALLLSPLDSKYSAQALCDVLTGVVSPSGKLASTVYCRTEDLYIRHKTYKVRDGLKTGSFIGYRYYDTAQDYPLFPFGHGLSYCNFIYSQLTVTGGVAEFSVTNRGKTAGVEIAQVYVGKSDSAVLRPKKELAGFVRIELAPGEKKTVRVPFCLPAVYDTQSGRFVEEAGNYTVFVGPSVAHTPLTHTMTAGSEQLDADGKNRSDYIQSESNILSDHFKLEAKYNTMKKSVLNYILGGLPLLLAIVLKMYCAYADVETVFLDIFSIILAIVGVVFLTLEAVRKHRLNSQERAAIDQASRQQFADTNAETVPFYSSEQMFVKEFDLTEDTQANTQDTGIEGVEADLVAYIDKDQDFVSAAKDFALFASERGCQFSEDTVRDLFASLASSRLLVVRGMNDGTFKKFMMVLSAYFETSAYIDRTDASYDKAENVLFKTDAGDSRVKTNTLLAIEAAQNSKHMIHFAALDHVIPENLPLYFTPFVNYARNPRGANRVTVPNEHGAETSYHIPQNLWFVLNLDHGKLPCALPDYISEVAVVTQFSFDDCHAESHPSHVRRFTYHQLEFLAERAVNKTSVPEEHWRKIDHLEKYVSDHTDFAIQNKTWLCLEKYAYVYLTCQGALLPALDRAICVKLMPQVIAALQDHLTADDRKLEDTIDMILGEDWPVTCKKLIHDCSVKKA